MKKRTIAAGLALILAAMVVSPMVANAAPGNLTTENLRNAQIPAVCHKHGRLTDGSFTSDQGWTSYAEKTAVGTLGGQSVGVIGIGCNNNGVVDAPSIVIYNSALKPIQTVSLSWFKPKTHGNIHGLKFAGGKLRAQVSNVSEKGSDNLDEGTADLTLKISHKANVWHVKRNLHTARPAAQKIANAAASINAHVLRKYLSAAETSQLVEFQKAKYVNYKDVPSSLKCAPATYTPFDPYDADMLGTTHCVMYQRDITTNELLPSVNIWAVYHGWHHYEYHAGEDLSD